MSRPDLIDMEVVSRQSNRENLEQAFEIAESLGVTRLLDAEGKRSLLVFLKNMPLLKSCKRRKIRMKSAISEHFSNGTVQLTQLF